MLQSPFILPKIFGSFCWAAFQNCNEYLGSGRNLFWLSYSGVSFRDHLASPIGAREGTTAHPAFQSEYGEGGERWCGGRQGWSDIYPSGIYPQWPTSSNCTYLLKNHHHPAHSRRGLGFQNRSLWRTFKIRMVTLILRDTKVCVRWLWDQLFFCQNQHYVSMIM